MVRDASQLSDEELAEEVQRRGDLGALVLEALDAAVRATADDNRGVQFSADLRERVANGTITVSYRLWSRPKVRTGGRYRSGSVTIEVDEIELLPFSSITDQDLARTG